MKDTVRTRLTPVISAVAALALLAGCGSSDEDTTPETTAEQTAEEGADQAEEAAAEEPAGNPTWGDTHDFDGLLVTFSEPREHEPSDYLIQELDGGRVVAFDITVENGKDEVYDGALFHTQATSGGRPTEELFDSGGGLDGTAMGFGSVPAGETLTVSAGWIIPEGSSDLRLEVAPELFSDGDPVFFEGEV